MPPKLTPENAIRQAVNRAVSSVLIPAVVTRSAIDAALASEEALTHGFERGQVQVLRDEIDTLIRDFDAAVSEVASKAMRIGGCVEAVIAKLPKEIAEPIKAGLARGVDTISEQTRVLATPPAARLVLPN